MRDDNRILLQIKSFLKYIYYINCVTRDQKSGLERLDIGEILNLNAYHMWREGARRESCRQPGAP